MKSVPHEAQIFVSNSRELPLYRIMFIIERWRKLSLHCPRAQDQLRKLSNSKTIDAMKEDIENLRLQIEKHITDNNENVKVGEIFIRQTS